LKSNGKTSAGNYPHNMNGFGGRLSLARIQPCGFEFNRE
jgi:hypothetical protein